MKAKTGMTALATALLLAASPLAMAQTGQAPADRGAPAAAGGMVSEAQVMQKLQAEGYSNIKLTPLKPGDTDRQSTERSGTSGPPANPQSTPGHQGWSGTATKNGKTVNIHVDPNGQITAR